MNNIPFVSVVVPVYNGVRTIRLCLDSLMNLNYPRPHLEIIVVDNNSTDGTAEIIKRYPVKYLFEPKRNRGRARNAGIKAATSELVAFIDADCLVDEDWLRYLVRGFTHPIIAGCGGKLLSCPPLNWIGQYYDTEYYSGNYSYLQERVLIRQKTPLTFIVTASAIFRRKVLEEVGLFAEDLYSNEDRDLGWRICLRGYKLKYIPEAIIYHQHRTTISSLWNHTFGSATDIPKLIQKYQAVRLVSPYPSLPYACLGKRANGVIRITYWFILLSRMICSCHNKTKPSFYGLNCLRTVAYITGMFYGWVSLLLNSSSKNRISIRINNQTLWREGTDGEIILFKPDRGSYYQLNEMGSKIWELMVMEDRNIEDIVDHLANKYGTEEHVIRKDVNELICGLKEEGLLMSLNLLTVRQPPK